MWLVRVQFGKPSVFHVTIVIFLEFFAWGLVTTILPEVSLQLPA
jgi:hypothetical protein